MRTIIVSLFACACALSPVQAVELAPMEGFSVKLGNVVGTAYYTVEKDGHQVVATVTSAESTSPIRVVATLLPGQSVMLSVPRSLGEKPLEVEFERREDQLFVKGKMSDLNQ